MSIEYSSGDLFESGCQALVCPVNCVGVMGKGLALEFKKRWPWYYKHYKNECDIGSQVIGAVRHFPQEGEVMLISFPTKHHWRDNSRIEDVESGLVSLRRLFWRFEEIKCLHPGSVAVPALGCGLGGLKWEEVKPIIEKYLGDLDCRVVVFPPKERS